MSMKKYLAIPLAAVLASGVVACSSDSGSSSEGSGSTGGTNYILTNGSEPQRALVPGDTSESGGGRIGDSLFAGLV